MEKFDYIGALDRLEELAVRVEDPSTGLEEIEQCIKESASIVEECRKYLRGCRDRASQLDKNA